MTKFRIKLKLTGLELEVEGSREDVPMMAKNIGAQLGNLIAPAAAMAAGAPAGASLSNEGHGRVLEHDAAPSRPKRSGTVRRAAAARGAVDEALVFVHDATAWGIAPQAWNTTDKAIWLLYICAKQNVASEMTTKQIIKTFEKHFRQAKISANVGRDLGTLKTKPPVKVSENATKTPPTWYLTEEGNKYAEALVLTARGTPAA